MEKLNGWIYTIVVIIIFSTIIEIMMPNSSMRKYIKLVLGFLVMTVILQPVFSLISKNFSITSETFRFQNQLESIYMEQGGEEYITSQSEEVIIMYKQNLEKQIVNQVRRGVGDRDIKVSVDINDNENSESFCEIEFIKVAIGEETNSIKKVEKVEIGSSENNDIQKDTESFKALVNEIAAMYNIDRKRIEISEGN